MSDKLKKFWKRLGPGLITGASDNDPAGITTYAIAGARFGLSLIWVNVFALPLMIAIQSMSARIGLLSGCGLAGNLKRYYPRFILIIAAAIIVIANILNVGANIYGMAGAVNLLIPLDTRLLAVILSILITILIIKLRYRQIANIFKWLALSTVVYIVATFIIHPDWAAILKSAVVPQIKFDGEFIATLFAMLGTTLAPYLYFWQASEEAEEVRERKPHIKICKFRDVSHGEIAEVEFDTKIGMTFSNVISFFVVALAASTLYSSGATGIETLQDAARALEPLAGRFASLLFAAGVIGSGLLAIPILAGSAAYVLAELFNWHGSLDKPFSKAREFYIVISAAILIGLFIPFLGISPVQALFYTALLNGFAAPILLMLIIHMSSNPKIVGDHVISPFTYVGGCIALFVMTAGAVYLIIA